MIRKDYRAKSMLDAKELAAKELRIPKSKMGLLAIAPAYDEESGDFAGWVAFFNGTKLEIKNSGRGNGVQTNYG